MGRVLDTDFNPPKETKTSLKPFVLLLFLACWSVVDGQSDIKFDITDALAVKTTEVTFEYYLDQDLSLGTSLLLNFQDRSSDFRYGEDLAITPFVRHYLSSDRLWNFFGEFFLMYNQGERDVTVEHSNGKEALSFTNLAFGFSGGYKYVAKSNFLIETHFGLGRNLWSPRASRDIVVRIGIQFGYRF